MKGNIKECVDFVASKFSYKYDKKFFIDQWFVMKDKDGKFHGDCDDFTITVLWYYYGCSLLSFVWNVLIARNAKVYKLTAANGEPHLVGNIGDIWFDNWSLKALPKEEFFMITKHNLDLFQHNFFTMWLKLVIGLFTR